MKIRHTIENEITWRKLKDMAEAGTAEKLYPLHSELDMTLTDGEVVTVQIAAFLPATEDKPAGIRFVFKDCLKEPHQMNKRTPHPGGYKDSEGRRYLLEEVMARLPAEVRDLIRPRKIVEDIKGERVEYSDPLWLPSATDVFGPSNGRWWKEETDSFQLPIFKRERDRVKEMADKGTWYWWLRSPDCTGRDYFCYVNTAGAANYDHAEYSFGVAPGFDF